MNNSNGKRAKGTFVLALLDLFSNFALILVWTLILLPSGQAQNQNGNPPPPESVPNTNEDGDSGIGSRTARITIDVKGGQVLVRRDGESILLETFLQEEGSFPDALIFQFEGVEAGGIETLRGQIERQGTKVGLQL